MKHLRRREVSIIKTNDEELFYAPSSVRRRFRCSRRAYSDRIKARRRSRHLLPSETGAGRAFASSRVTNNAWQPHPVPTIIVGLIRATPLRPSSEGIGEGTGGRT